MKIDNNMPDKENITESEVKWINNFYFGER